MAETTTSSQVNIPPAVIEFFPLGAGLAYFLLAVFVFKKEVATSGIIAGLIALALFTPRLIKENEQALQKGVNALKDMKEAMPDADINKMNSAGRKQAVDYILQRQKLRKADEPTITDAMRISALQSLTNAELKMLYVITKFDEKRKELLTRYGTAQGDEMVRAVAKHDFGIDLSDINNIGQTSTDAMSKVLLSYQNTLKG